MNGTIPTFFAGNEQQNLRNRVASTCYYENYNGIDDNYNNAMHYSYDIHGNVKTILQEIKSLGVSDWQHLKTIEYDYDLVSGNVKQVSYQAGEKDEMYHKYEYDADNRITNVWTSTNGIDWEQDAKYFYYKHGPLAREEIGDDKLQGIDYAYTLQGWLKGVNSNTMKPNRDIGGDAYTGNTSGNINQWVGSDEFGFTLGYYDGDYTAVDQTMAAGDLFEADNSGSSIASNNLYNGNISHMVTAIRHFIDNGGRPDGLSYVYDQLNRIKSSTYHTSSTLMTNNNWGTTNTPGDYDTEYSYDANGNIDKINRNSGNNEPMDDLTLYYGGERGTRNNKLRHVADGVDETAFATDIDDQGNYEANDANTWNYKYDEIGNLIADASEEIEEIVWTNSGKVKEVIRIDGSTFEDLEFEYDAQGNRITKIVKEDGSPDKEDWTYTHYVRDAQGNVLSIYESTYDNSDNLTQLHLAERILYGSSRLGIMSVDKDISIQNTAQETEKIDIFAGKKQFELKNHLGNVLATVSDKLEPVDEGTDNMRDYYNTYTTSANNYYPFGSIMDKDINLSSSQYRFGFNGQEKDDEITGVTGSHLNFKYRMYDSRIARFFAVDPLTAKYPYWTPYQFAGLTPIWARELEGLEPYITREELEELPEGHIEHQGFSKSIAELRHKDRSGEIFYLAPKEDSPTHMRNYISIKFKPKLDVADDDLTDRGKTKNREEAGKEKQGFIEIGFTYSSMSPKYSESGTTFESSSFRETRNKFVETVNQINNSEESNSIDVFVGNVKGTEDDIIENRINLIKQTLRTSGYKGDINVQTGTTKSNMIYISPTIDNND